MKQKYIRNSLFNILGWLWVSLLTMFSVPFMISKLGVEGYGVLILVTTMMGYFAFLDLGLTDSVVRFVAEAKARNDIIYMNQIVGSSLVFYLGVGCIGASIIYFGVNFFVTKVFTIPLALQGVAKFGILLSSVGFIVNMLLSVVAKVSEGLQRFDVSNKITVLFSTITVGGNIVILLIGYRLYSLFIFNFMVSLFSLSAFIIVNIKIQQGLRFFPAFSSTIFKKMLSFGVNTFVARFESFVTSNINTFFITSLLGTAALTVFSIPFRLVGRINSLLYRLSYTLFPLASEFAAQSNHDQLIVIYMKVSRVVLICSVIFHLPCIFFSHEILLLWLGRELADQGWKVMLLMSGSLLLTALTIVPSLVTNGIGKPQINTMAATLTLLLNIVLVYPLISLYGVTGAALSSFISVLHAPFYIYYVNKKILNVKPYDYFKRIFQRVGYVIVILFILKFISIYYINKVWAESLILGVSILFIIAVFFLNPKTTIDHEIRTLVIQTLKKFKTSVATTTQF